MYLILLKGWRVAIDAATKQSLYRKKSSVTGIGYDVPFIVRHEFGHAFNEKRGKFGQFISNRRDYAEAFMRDFKKVSPELLDQLGLSENFKPLELARDEVFADMYAHSSGLQSNNPYSQLLKQYFPSCLKYLEDMPKW